MKLLFIILFLVVFSLISNFFYKYNKIFILFSILIVISFYFFLSKNFFHTESFYPGNEIHVYKPCGNYYNLLINSLKEGKLYIADFKNLQSLLPFDASEYKGKIYIYFGLTPLLIFYVPFHLITTIYLTDKLLVLLLSSLFFILSLLILKIFIQQLKFKLKPFMIILSIFLIGVCNYLPFLVIRGAIYEVCILTAMICLILSTIILYYLSNNDRHKHLFIILLGLLLALCVGARPQYILFIPVFYITLIYIECIKETDNAISITELSILFFMPCIIYGIIIATYNYLRFDSFIEFGWSYQLNEFNQHHYFKGINNILVSLKYNLFQIPQIGTETIFSLVKSEYHTGGKEYVTGIIYSFPLLLNFIFIYPFLKHIAKNKNIFICILLLLILAITNFTVTSLISGIITRYVFEYLSIFVLISLLIFYWLLNKQEKTNLQLILTILFVVIFIFSMYINISLLFCKENSIFFNKFCGTNYSNIVNFLF